MLLLFSSHLLSQNNFSPDPFIFEQLLEVYDLNDHVYIIEDQEGTFSLDRILDQPLDFKFEKFDKESPLNAEFVYWLRFQIVNDSSFHHEFDNWKLFLEMPDFATVYILDEDGVVKQEIKSGLYYPSSKKDMPFGNIAQRVNISFDASVPITIYVRYAKKDHHPPAVDVSLRKYDFYQSLDFVINTRRDWAFLGFALTMILLNLIVYWNTRYIAFLYHGLFILGTMIFTLDYFGVTDDLPFINNRAHLVQFVDYIGLLLMDVCYFQFIRHYLNLKQLMPRWDRAFVLFIYTKIIFFIGLTILYYTTFNEPLADKILATFFVTEYLFILIFLFPLFMTKEKKGLFIIGGTLLLFLAISMNAYSIINSRGIWTLMTEVGIVGEILFFTLGLGFRFKELRNEEQEAHRLKELDEYKSKLFTNITHEFRTPLTVIQGVSELSRDYLKTNNVAQLESGFQTIERNNSDLLNLVNQMLDLAKLENKDMHVNLSQHDILDVLTHIIKSIQPLATKNGVGLNFHFSEEKVLMDLDQDKIQTVITNLLSNAIKFTPEDGLVTLHLEGEKKEDNHVAHITVSDTGYGISETDLPFIFDRFYQIESGPSRKFVGTGIGLALVKELVDLMKGELKVTSKLGEGTAFKISLPITNVMEIRTVEQVGLQFENSVSSVIPYEIKKKTAEQPVLLIVEDNLDIVNYLISLLEDSYILEITHDGNIGLEKALKVIPDIIISDVMMPGMDGIELCAELKLNEKTNHIPIIILTAKAAFEDKLEGLQTGADAYLTKPFKKEELFIRLKNLNELRSTLQKKYSQFALIDKPNALKGENSFIHLVNSVIEKNLTNEQFGVEDLAKGVFMSRMQLHRKLKALSMRSASNYIRNYRLYKAKPLLKDLSQSIADVAWAVGFHDPNYFTKSFSKEFGITPTEFRSKN